MGQTRGTNHQGQGVGEHVDSTQSHIRRVLREAQVSYHHVQSVQQVNIAACQGASQAQLGYGIARQLKADENRRDRVGQDQHAILCNLGVGNTLHAAEHSVEEHDGHTHVEASVIVHFQET